MTKVRVRFAPSPTGGLHIGGVRTALFNYLFAKKNEGQFILRIEDTDQSRFVSGAEDYIQESLEWLGIRPDESPTHGGDYGPYRQSERKEIYKQYVDQLIQSGNAYYAFDTPKELEEMRERLTAAKVIKPQYNTITRQTMKNSLTLPPEVVQERLAKGDPYVIRIKIPQEEEVRLKDLVRGWVRVSSEEIDDKVLMKSDGMPTYHLANVVDDHLMEITHVIRGEEWLPSAPLHVLLYEFLGWEDNMPEFAHLPLILKPDGNGKLSKRVADKAGFPIFPLNWTDPESKEVSVGFKENGYLADALNNFLAFLGWNPGTEKEIFSLSELIDEFSIERVNKAGTKFDIEKVRWFNQQYIKSTESKIFAKNLVSDLSNKYQLDITEELGIKLVELLNERITHTYEFLSLSADLFVDPVSFDEKVQSKKWGDDTGDVLELFSKKLEEARSITAEEAKELFWSTLEKNGYKPGQFMQTLRLALTGQGSGPDLMGIIEILGAEKSAQRINNSIKLLKK